MKNILVAIALVVGFGAVSSNVYAQKDKKAQKAEIKKWKKALKKVEPLEYRDMVTELNVAKGQASGLKAEITKLEKENSSLSAQLKSKSAQLAEMEAKVKKAEAKPVDVSAVADDWTKGVVYKVQIGAFRNIDLKQYQNDSTFWVEEEDGVKKYTIAYFRDYEEADHFKKYMRKMGVKDAWIVAYEDNIRKDIKDAMGAQKKSNAESSNKSRRKRR